MKPPRKLLRLTALLEKVGVSADSLDDLMKADGFPRPLKLSRRVLLWDEYLVDEWIEKKAREAQGLKAA